MPGLRAAAIFAANTGADRMGYAAVLDQGVYDLVERANVARLGGMDDADARAAEGVCRDVFGSESRVAVYGAFAPGEAKHYMLTPFRGVWTPGFVRGRLEHGPWSTALGMTAIRLEGGADRIPVHVLTAPMLDKAWGVFDAASGLGFARLLTPVENSDGVAAIANIFALPDR
ncbi:MAG: hypothetical protein EA355_04800 [Rhodobacteraceae bacterium]|nr:MAG: hypothetical protein EA355_04800 [Paracoccaceae bacterium]